MGVGSQFLPGDAVQAVEDLLAARLTQISVGSIGALEINDDDQLVWDPPCVRTRYAGSKYATTHDNQMLAYNADHIVELWCAAENLTSKEAQRQDTMTMVVHQVLPQIVGARLALEDGSKSEPVRVVDIKGFVEDIAGMLYIISVAVPGIAQFPGTNA